MTSELQVATGISYGRRDQTGHVERAVRSALEKVGATRANGLLLFLTSDYAHEPLPAIRSAARIASCTQVSGATGLGLLTEEQWVIDSSGAAAMAFTGHIGLESIQHAAPGRARLCLCTPQSVSADWLGEPIPRFGAISSDEYGHGPFAIWHSGALAKDGFMESTVRGASASIGVARGVQVLTAPMKVDKVAGYDIQNIAGYPALHVMIRSLPEETRKTGQLHLHMVMCGVVFGEPEGAIAEGRFRLDHIVSANTEDNSITLSHPLQPGQHMFWALRDSAAAERTMQDALQSCRDELGGVPDFAFMFPCLSRGPLFYGGTDKDVTRAREMFPGTPLIGFYGNGEIAPIGEYSHLHQYSTVVAAFRGHNA